MSDDIETDLDEAEEVRAAETEARLKAENKAERAERAERMAREDAQAMAEHLAAQVAVDERTKRLRSLRLAKEASDAQAAATAKQEADEAKAAKDRARKSVARKTAKKD